MGEQPDEELMKLKEKLMEDLRKRRQMLEELIEFVRQAFKDSTEAE